MPASRYDVLGIGNAIVDVIARAEDDFLVAQGMHKGGMALIDEARAAAIYAAMGPAMEISGGSAANTIVGVAGFGGARGLRRQGQGRRARPRLRARHPRRRRRLRYASRRQDGPSTARCYVMVTPDGERTMNTYLGAAQDLHPADVDAEARSRPPPSSISRAICGIRRTPRRRSSRPPRSRTTPAARWR